MSVRSTLKVIFKTWFYLLLLAGSCSRVVDAMPKYSPYYTEGLDVYLWDVELSEQEMSTFLSKHRPQFFQIFC